MAASSHLSADAKQLAEGTRGHFKARPLPAATRVGVVISYTAAFANGLAWNALNMTIVVGLLLRSRGRLGMA